MLFVGDDWAEDHHDVELVDEAGRRLARARLAEGLEGLSRLHALIAERLPEEWADVPAQEAARRVVVGIETDRGPWVRALIAAGYVVFAINPMQVARYRERHSTSGAKSDAGDAHVLAEIVRLDREHHRPVAGDSPDAEAVKLLARTHQSMIWDRTRQVLRLRSVLREFFPDAADVPVAHAWAGVLGVPRDWAASVGHDRESGLGWAGGYVGTGVTATNLAGRTLADLVLGRDTDLVRLPWVGHRAKRWEPEPLRWLAVNAIYTAYRAADRAEASGSTGRTAWPAHVADIVAGRH